MSTHGYINLIVEKCTSCDLCVRECPSWCISLTARDEIDASQGGRARTKKVLETFEIDYGLCIYCGICVDVCPFDALEWSEKQATPAVNDRGALVHGIDRLSDNS